MATVYYCNTKRRWTVRWFDDHHKRITRRFTDEQTARTFATSIDGEITRRPGPPAHPLTPEGIRAIIRERSQLDENGCWIWAAAGGSNGYAQMTRRINGMVTAFSMHRLSYEAHVGPIPDGLTIDHLCAVPKCVNPAHLEPVTLAENNRRRSTRQAVAR